MCVCVCGGLCGLPKWTRGNESACNAVDAGSILGPGRSSGGGHGNPLQRSCLENPLERRTWRNLQSIGSHRVDWKHSARSPCGVFLCLCVSESAYACGGVLLAVHRCAHVWRKRKKEIDFV